MITNDGQLANAKKFDFITLAFFHLFFILGKKSIFFVLYSE